MKLLTKSSLNKNYSFFTLFFSLHFSSIKTKKKNEKRKFWSCPQINTNNSQMNGLCGGPVSIQERTGINSGVSGTGSPIRRGGASSQYTIPDSMRKSRSQGGKKLQKCLSTASYGEELSISRPQMTPVSHNLLMTRQYCSFGSTTSNI